MAKYTMMEISFERSVKKAEYENERSGVKLGVSPDDPDSSLTEADLAAASALAKVQVYTTLGLPVAVGNGGKVTTKATVKPVEKIAEGLKEAISVAKGETAPARVTPPSAPVSSTEIGGEDEQLTPEVVIKATPINTAKPGSGRPKGSTNKPKDGIPPPPKAASAEIGDEEDGDNADETPGTAADAAEAEAPPAAITNGDLAKAIGKKVQAMVAAGNAAGSTAVNKLIKDFVPAVKQATHPNIPDAARGGFLAALEAVE